MMTHWGGQVLARQDLFPLARVPERGAGILGVKDLAGRPCTGIEQDQGRDA
jgi:hypothetical protein